MNREINYSKGFIGDGHPVFIIAEIGINHNGSLDIAKKLIEGAKAAGCDAVKFQKRTPEICVPKDQWYVERDTPWGRMTYIDYRHVVEFTKDDYAAIDKFCKEKNIVEVHHYDENKKNNSPSNLIPLCPTHHQYYHSRFKHLVQDKINDYLKSHSENRIKILKKEGHEVKIKEIDF